MSTRQQKITLLTEAGPVADAVEAVLAERGHQVRQAFEVSELLRDGDSGILVIDLGMRGPLALQPIHDLRASGCIRYTRIVVLTAHESVEECRMALQIGASDYLSKPFAVEAFLRIVEAPLSTAARTPGRFTRIFPATPASIDRAAREVSAFSLRCSISPTARARVATCCAELVENAVRHAHTDSAGTVEVELTVDGRRVEMVVRDCGKGFDAVALGLDHMIDARDGGLARVSALSEDFQIESSDAGTVARASFDIFRVRFDGEGGLDLSEHDWLAPETTRSLLEVLTGSDREENLELSPALAVTVGRLLAGPDRRRVLQTALWS